MHAEFIRLLIRCLCISSDDVRRMVVNAAADDDDDDGKINNKRAVTKDLHSCGVIVFISSVMCFGCFGFWCCSALCMLSAVCWRLENAGTLSTGLCYGPMRAINLPPQYMNS